MHRCDAMLKMMRGACVRVSRLIHVWWGDRLTGLGIITTSTVKNSTLYISIYISRHYVLYMYTNVQRHQKGIINQSNQHQQPNQTKIFQKTK